MRLELDTDFSTGKHKGEPVPEQASEVVRHVLDLIASRRWVEPEVMNSIESISWTFKGGPFSLKLLSTIIVVESVGEVWAQVQVTRHELRDSEPFGLGDSVPNAEMLADKLLNRVAEVLNRRKRNKIVA